MTVYVKFCGGCNPRYDRNDLLQQIVSSFPEIRFTHSSEEIADAVIILCGCITACTNKGDTVGTHGTFVIWQKEEVAELYAFLEQINKLINKE